MRCWNRRKTLAGSWRGRAVAIRIAGRTVEVTLVEGEPMEMRIAVATRKLTAGVTLQVPM
jgi:Glycosyl hydrolase family 65, C-terminal domain